MRIGLTPAQEAFRAEVRRYFEGVMTPELRRAVEREIAGEGVDGPILDGAYRQLIRRFGRDGWLCPTWPVEYGGRGLSEVEAFLFFDETQRLGVPMPFLTTNTVGPTLMRYGTDEQKRSYLPRIVRGEILFCIGYTEPQAGTDLAALETRAVRDGDHYVISGQKVFTSLVHVADYVWLACRTDPDAPRHRGISIIIVPTDAEGFSWTRIDTIGGGLTSATFYDEVRVPVANLVGRENEGWKLITSQLNHERIALAPAGVIQRRLEEVRRWAATTRLADGRRVLDLERVRTALARVHAQTHALELMNWKVADEASRGQIDPADASAMKVYGSELAIEAWRTLMEMVGEAALEVGEEAILGGDLETQMRRAVILTFGGGTNEIQRDIIATMGLGLPRGAR